MMLIELAQRGRASTLRFDPEETAKHHLPDDPAVVRDARSIAQVDICFALGGDGTILSALRSYAGTRACRCSGSTSARWAFWRPSTARRHGPGALRALAGDFEVLSLPGSSSDRSRDQALAINDISIHRQPGKRVADLEYSVGGDEVGRVRCDGLVVSTPAGSTGYNLANGGSGHGLGRARVRGLVHLPALAHRADAGRRAHRPAGGRQPLPRGAGRRDRRRAAGRACWTPGSGSRRGS